MATDSKATDMEVDTMDNMTTLITAMGVAKITVSDKCPQGTKTNARSFIFMVHLVVQKISVPFFSCPPDQGNTSYGKTPRRGGHQNSYKPY